MFWKRMPILTSRRRRTWPSRPAPQGYPTMSCWRRSLRWACPIAPSGGTSMVERAAVALGCLAAAVLSSSCADQQKAREGEMTELLVMLVGHYDNTAQVQSDTQRGLRPTHDPLALTVIPVDDPLI